MPSKQEVVEFMAAFEQRHSVLKDVYCVSDGLKILLHQSGDTAIQNDFYNVRTHDHYVCNIFVFTQNGFVILCALNTPGCLTTRRSLDMGTRTAHSSLFMAAQAVDSLSTQHFVESCIPSCLSSDKTYCLT